MGRMACMGLDVYSLLDKPLPLFNVQKGRVDYLTGVAADPSRRARPSQVAPFLARTDIMPFIAQQADLSWLECPPPAAVYMDSYSELTDQFFLRSDRQWGFCSNYSDLDHSAAFAKEFSSEGLLPSEQLTARYREFFSMVRKRWGAVPVVFMHFPAKLDGREKFRLRYRAIVEAIGTVAAEFQPFLTFRADDSRVDWPEIRPAGLENFPYHFNSGTYQYFAEQIRAAGVPGRKPAGAR